MSEIPETSAPEIVYWINSGQLIGQKEKFQRWFQESVRGKGTFTPKRVRNQEFQTEIPISEIELLAVESLKAALYRQVADIVDDEDSLTIPVATADGSQHHWTWRIPRHPIF